MVTGAFFARLKGDPWWKMFLCSFCGSTAEGGILNGPAVFCSPQYTAGAGCATAPPLVKQDSSNLASLHLHLLSWHIPCQQPHGLSWSYFNLFLPNSLVTLVGTPISPPSYFVFQRWWMTTWQTFNKEGNPTARHPDGEIQVLWFWFPALRSVQSFYPCRETLLGISSSTVCFGLGTNTCLELGSLEKRDVFV